MEAALAPATYAGHRPEATLLYELVEQHYPAFVAALRQTQLKGCLKCLVCSVLPNIRKIEGAGVGAT